MKSRLFFVFLLTLIVSFSFVGFGFASDFDDDDDDIDFESVSRAQRGAADGAEPVLAEDLKEQIRKVERKWGRAVKRSEQPALYDLVHSVFSRLALAQNRQLAEDHVPINYIYVLDTNVENAFVLKQTPSGTRVEVNLVFVTAGMISSLIDVRADRLKTLYPTSQNPLREEVHSGIQRLSGVLAHELAHPLDWIVRDGRRRSNFSISKTYGERASQALEIRADLDGAQMQREAHLPQNGMLRAAERVLSDSRVDIGTAEGVNAHPNVTLRKSAMRLYLTQDRLRRGADRHLNPIQVSEAQLPALQAALLAITEHDHPKKIWVEPKNLDDILFRLRRISRLEKDVDLEFNRLIIALDRELIRSEKIMGQVTARDEERIVEVFQFLQDQNIIPDLWDQNKTHKELGAYRDSKSLLEVSPHRRMLDQLKFYNGSAYINVFYDRIAETISKLRLGEGVDLNFFSYLPTRIIEENFAQLLFENDQHAILSENRSGKRPGVKALPADLRDRYSALLVRNLIAESNRAADLEALIKNALLAASNGYARELLLWSPPRADRDDFAAERRAQWRKLKRLKPPSKADAVSLDIIHDWASTVWENRDIFAVLELLYGTEGERGRAAETFIDWGYISEVLGLEAKSVPKKIADSVSALIHNRARFEVVMYSLGSAVAGDKGRLTHGFRVMANRPKIENSNGVPTIWYNYDLGTALIAALDRPAETVVAANGHHVLQRALLIRDPENALDHYRKHMAAFFSQNTGLLTHPLALLQKAEQYYTQYSWTIRNSGQIIYHLSHLGLAEAIDSSLLSSQQKADLLAASFIRGGEITQEQHRKINPDWTDWLTLPRPHIEKVFGILKKYSVIDSAATLLERLRKSPHFAPFENVRTEVGSNRRQASEFTTYFDILHQLAPLLRVEIAGIRSPSELERYLSLLNTPHRLDVDVRHSNAPEIRDLRDSIVAKSTSHDNGKLNVTLFLKITATGASKQTDDFFNSNILPLFAKGHLSLVWAKQILVQDRILSHEMRLDLAKRVLEPTLQEYQESSSVASEELYKLLNDLHKMAPQGSISKDKYIESIGVRLRLRDARLFAFVEDQKTSNWRRGSPYLVNASSVLINGISKMSVAKRKQLLRFLIDPHAHPDGIPEVLVDEFFKHALGELARRRKVNDEVENRLQDSEIAKKMARMAKIEIDQFLRDAAPLERIPIIEATLNAGNNSFARSSEFPFNITRDFLKYQADSFEEKAFLAYLDVIPSEEVTPHLAYLLSQATDKKSTVADIFALFGAPGKKTGQFVSVFPVFGPRIAEEAKVLKNDAPPMTLHDIYAQADQHLSPEVSRDIQVEEIISTASIKTVSRIRLKSDGRRGVMYTRDPHIEDQNRTHAEFGRRYIEALDKRGLLKRSRLFAALVESMDDQLAEEIDFSLEASKAKEVARIVEIFNSENKDTLNGWTFESLRPMQGMPITKAVSSYDFAEGVPFDELSSSDKAEIGRHLAVFSLQMLFRHRLFCADRHMKNWLIDVRSKKITFLDPGQVTLFSNHGRQDHGKIILDFLMAISTKNTESVFQAMLAMTERGEGKTLSPELRSQIDSALTNESVSTALVDLLTAFVEDGSKLQRRYLFGLGKGIVILSGERYVGSEAFIEILSKEARTSFMARNFGGQVAQPTDFDLVLEEFENRNAAKTCQSLF